MLYFDRNVRIAYIIDWKIFYTYGVTTFARCIFCGWHLAKGVTFFIARTETDLYEYYIYCYIRCYKSDK